jgi:predicted O-methyltransferase YrrM
MNTRYWTRHPLMLIRRAWYVGYERLHPKTPFLAPAAVRFLDRRLPRAGIGLEWGSGRSTRWLARRLAWLVSIEYDDRWHAIVAQQLAEEGLSNVDLRLVPLDHPLNEPTRPAYDPLPRYVALANAFPDGHFDFIEVDGHYRQACVAAAVEKLKPGGLLLIVDTVTSVWCRPE